MKITVIGASGRSGREVVAAGLRRGHDMTAAARRPAALEPVADGVRVIEADVLVPASLRAAVVGAEAVISTLGSAAGRADTDVYSRGAANLLAAIDPKVPLVVLSASPAGPRGEQPWLKRRVLMPALERFFGGSYGDMRRMEQLLAGGQTPWLVLRPPRLDDRAGTGRYRCGPGPPAAGRRISRADLADAALDAAEGRLGSRCALYVAA